MINIPKLKSSVAAQVEEAEGGDFEALPEGVYLAVLDGEVEACEGPKGLYWKWTFKLVGQEDGTGKGRKMFLNTSLNEGAMWKLKEVFSAFGVSADTDTDELIGGTVKLMIVQRIIGAGARKGEMGNDVQSVLPASEAAEASGKAAKTGSKKKSSVDDDVPLF